MKFKTKKEALHYAGAEYVRDDKMVVLDSSYGFKQLIDKWFYAKDKNKQLIKINGDKFYYKDYKNGIRLFSAEDDKIYISESEFEKFWNKQYWNWKVEEAKKDSSSYIFKEYVTEEILISRNAILKQIAKSIFV